jgi:hypothetical protein
MLKGLIFHAANRSREQPRPVRSAEAAALRVRGWAAAGRAHGDRRLPPFLNRRFVTAGEAADRRIWRALVARHHIQARPVAAAGAHFDGTTHTCEYTQA